LPIAAVTFIPTNGVIVEVAAFDKLRKREYCITIDGNW
jgi:hypothetical protein